MVSLPLKRYGEKRSQVSLRLMTSFDGPANRSVGRAMSGDKEKYPGLNPIPPDFVREYPPIAKVIEEKCIACDRCPPLCFFDSIVMEGRANHPFGRTAVIVPENCTGCGLCFEACPVDAIVWVPDMSPGALAARPPRPDIRRSEDANT